MAAIDGRGIRLAVLKKGGLGGLRWLPKFTSGVWRRRERLQQPFRIERRSASDSFGDGGLKSETTVFRKILLCIGIWASSVDRKSVALDNEKACVGQL